MREETMKKESTVKTVIPPSVQQKLCKELVMMKNFKVKSRRVVFALGTAVSMLIILYFWNFYNIKKQTLIFNFHSSVQWSLPSHSKEWYVQNCFQGSFDPSISGLKKNLELWTQSNNQHCQELLQQMQLMFSIDDEEGELYVSPAFAAKVKGWLKNKDELFQEFKHQRISQIYNIFTLEHTAYNPLRSKRPVGKPGQDPWSYLQQLVADSEKSCDFCNYKNMTAVDPLGRIETAYSVTAANAFKVDKWHALFLTKRHDPFTIQEEELVDLFDISLKWFQKVHSVHPDQKYPVLLWDMLPHGGASQVHPHIHGLLNNHRYHGALEQLRHGAEQYFLKTGRNYWTDFVGIHRALGLSATLGNATAIIPLCARKDHEVMIISETPGTDLFRLMHYVLRTYMDHLSLFCFSSGMAFPVLDHRKQQNLPAIIRIGTRGECSSVRSDVSSLELYGIYNINSDPYETIHKLRKSVQENVKKRPYHVKEKIVMNK